MLKRDSQFSKRQKADDKLLRGASGICSFLSAFTTFSKMFCFSFMIRPHSFSFADNSKDSLNFALAVANRINKAEKFRTLRRWQNFSADKKVSWKQSAASARLPGNRHAVFHTTGLCRSIIVCQSLTCKSLWRLSLLLCLRRPSI